MSDPSQPVAEPPPQTRADGLTLVRCASCENSVPSGEFCGVCGAHLATASGDGANRRHAYAAHPAERVLHLSVISTLLPHLPHRRSAPFRIALLLVASVLLLMGLLQATAPTIAVAAVAVPLLYLLYLYEVEVYEDDPVVVLGLTMLGGAILGGLWAHFFGSVVTSQVLLASATGLHAGGVIVGGALVPLLSQALMLIPALILLVIRYRSFDEALDGFTFGAASALGFTLAATLVDLFPQLQAGLHTNTAPLDNMIDVAIRGLLVPIICASATGLIGAAIWLLKGRKRPDVHHRLASLPAVAIIAAVAQMVLGIAGIALRRPWELLIVYLIITGALLLLVRWALHSMLLAEAVEVEIGPPFPCSHCHHIVPRMAFCPNCGIATRATPKSGIGRHARGVR